jgi:hypothetical protein
VREASARDIRRTWLVHRAAREDGVVNHRPKEDVMYNAQAATNERQIVITAEVTVASPDFGHLEPMVNAAKAELAAVGVTDTPKVVLADAGYRHQEQMERVVAAGSQVLIPPDSSRRQNTRPGWDRGLYAFMRRVLATDRGGELYALRQQLIEPVFANTKFNDRWSGFTDEEDRPAGPNGA